MIIDLTRKIGAWDLPMCSCVHPDKRYLEKRYQIDEHPDKPWGDGKEYYLVECRFCGSTFDWDVPDDWRTNSPAKRTIDERRKRKK